MVNLNDSDSLYGWHKNIENKQALNVTLLIAKISGIAVTTNTIYSRQVHVMATYVFIGFLLRLQDKLDVLKQSYTAQRELYKLLNIWGTLLL